MVFLERGVSESGVAGAKSVNRSERADVKPRISQLANKC
jgi:hypothetical protein